MGVVVKAFVDITLRMGSLVLPDCKPFEVFPISCANLLKPSTGDVPLVSLVVFVHHKGEILVKGFNELQTEGAPEAES